MFDESTNTLLQLTPHEIKILACLQYSELNISNLAKLCKFPRTTLYTALTSLTSRGLIETRTQGKARVVSRRPHMFIPKMFKTNKSLSIIEVWRDITKLKNQRIYAIQSTASMKEAVQRFNSGEFIPINELIKKNNIIIESILNRNHLSEYVSMYNHDSEMKKKILDSFENRMTDVTFVDNQYLHTKTDLVITHNRAYLMQWKKDVCIEIEEREIVDFLKQLFELVQGYGKKINFNQYVKESKLRLVKA